LTKLHAPSYREKDDTAYAKYTERAADYCADGFAFVGFERHSAHDDSDNPHNSSEQG
jgi:hypothetical protein